MKYTRLIIVSVIITVSIMTLVFFHLNDSIDTYENPVAKDSLSHTLINYSINIENTGQQIPDIQLDHGTLSALLKDRQQPILVLRIKETHCNVCVTSVLKMMSKFMGGISNDMLILGTYSADRNLRILLKREDINVLSQNITDDVLHRLVMEQYDSPYCFVLHPNMKISNIYIPDMIFNSINEQYWESIKRFLSD